MKRTFLIIPQFIAYLLFKGASSLLLPKRVRLPDSSLHLDKDRHYVIAANHQSGLDPFVICTSLPLRHFLKLFPFRFITHRIFFERWWLKPWLHLIGCYPTKADGDGKSSIETSIEFVRKGYTIFIFPEGRRTLPHQTPAKTGIGLIAEAGEADILPVHIDWQKKSWWRRAATVSIGHPLSPQNLTPQDIMDHIYEL